MNYWIEHCESPRNRPEGYDWDVFISYRSLDRVWALALHDMLTQCGYKVFMDQFVLVAGQGLSSQLGKSLVKSASGVLLWSEKAADSKWVEAEYDSMMERKLATADDPCPFHFAVASLDGRRPPGLQGGQLYLDFSDYPDGPMGGDLARLTSGLSGKPLSPQAVLRVSAFEEELRAEPARLRALAVAENYDEILARCVGDSPGFKTSAMLPGIAVDLLIRGRQYDEALQATEALMRRFPKSIRLRQLYGLTLRRLGRLDDALYQVGLLYEEGHRDTETLGIYAAVWADMWEKRSQSGDDQRAKDALEQSRNLYSIAFEKVPDDTYTGINAASKSALLGDMEQACAIAARVLDQLEQRQQERNGEPAPDLWERITMPEAHLLLGNEEVAVALYHDARVAHQNERGSLQSAGDQIRRLLGVLDVSASTRVKLEEEFALKGRD